MAHPGGTHPRFPSGGVLVLHGKSRKTITTRITVLLLQHQTVALGGCEDQRELLSTTVVLGCFCQHSSCLPSLVHQLLSSNPTPHSDAVPHSRRQLPVSTLRASLRAARLTDSPLRCFTLVSEALASLCVDAQGYPCTGIRGCDHHYLRRDI